MDPAAARHAPPSPAAAYERLLVPALFAPTADRAVQRAEPRPDDRIVDVACGSGIGLRTALAHADRSTASVGIDVDASMLAEARLRTAVPLRAACGWAVADAQALPLPDATFDVGLCLQGLQFVADPVRAMGEMRRVVAGGGRLVAATWCPLDQVPGHRAVYEALQAHGVDTASPRRGFSLGDPAQLLDLARRAGWQGAVVEREERVARFASAGRFVEGLFLGAPYTRRVTAALPRDAFRRCFDDACRRLRPFESVSSLDLPVAAWLLHARVGAFPRPQRR